MNTIEKINQLEMKLLEVQLKADKALDLIETISKFMDQQQTMNVKLLDLVITLTSK